MHEEDDLCEGDPDTVLGRVRDIRRKWAIQEDEGLAHRLQSEEIAQHYNSNRTRNAIVREDAPKAREAQRQEELQALEERLKHLSVLQKQAEEDAKIAKQLASKDAEASKSKRHAAANGKSEKSSLSPKLSPPELMQQVVKEVAVSSAKRTKSPLMGAAASGVSSSSSSSPEEPGTSRSCFGSPEKDEVDIRKLQEERDAAVARALQEEIDRLEKDKLLALEAQDRELAKMLHEKEKARLRRAKEKARLKAEVLAAERGETPDSESVRVASRNSSSSERSSRSTDLVPPPRLPEKQRSPTGDHIGFRAHPKPLPPHPSELSISPALQHRSEHRQPMPLDPIPPYMPIHGYNRSSPKRNK